MLFEYSSSSESADENPYGEVDRMVDDFVTHHLPNTFFPRGPRLRNVNDVILIPADNNCEERLNRLFNDYFTKNPVYSDKQFRRRFRMRRPLFCRIMNKVVENDVFLQQRRNAAGKLGLSGLQKCIAAIRMLAYGSAPDAIDEYLRMGKAPPITFQVNEHEYNIGYYLTNGINPNWAMFIQGFSHLQLETERLFADRQTHVRKDVERAFGVLQARFAILRQPSLAHDEDI
ncbi:uncharacterized protein [Spinacia oleracea]|uniref:DDE Tnp4 domain-containing protein n=1 Tax=Spinacia oleracea TaxID=3562 RepID=A0A9R0J0K8_SPIOL|nr:uncharacterized protein LOC110798182 [Spinacia oleracea]